MNRSTSSPDTAVDIVVDGIASADTAVDTVVDEIASADTVVDGVADASDSSVKGFLIHFD